MSFTIELVAAAFGVLGTVLLALNGKRAGWGFIAYLVSNAGWILFAWMHAHWGMLAQQVAFTLSSFLGVWMWLIRPNLSTWVLDTAFWLNQLADRLFKIKMRSSLARLVANALHGLSIRVMRFHRGAVACKGSKSS